MTGVLLAAGAGRRAGGPKALRRDRDGVPWLRLAVDALVDGGCDDVVVVLGAGAEESRPILAQLLSTRTSWPAPVRSVLARDWASGMAASLRAGLACVAPTAVAACVHLVDLPDVGADVVARMITDAGRDTLARARYGERPGHPVVIGADHLRPLAATLTADVGGRRYLHDHRVRGIDCRDLATGADLDGPPDAEQVRTAPGGGRRA